MHSNNVLSVWLLLQVVASYLRAENETLLLLWHVDGRRFEERLGGAAASDEAQELGR